MSEMAQTHTGFRSHRGIGGVVILLIVVATAWFWYSRSLAGSALEDASLEELQKITTERPKDARAFYYLGLQLTKRRKFDAAYAAHKQAADLAPNDEEVWIAYAGSTNQSHGVKASFQVMRDFLKAHPDGKKMKEERDSLLIAIKRGADGHAGAKRDADAAKYYQLILDEDPGNAEAQTALEVVEKRLQANEKKKPGSAFLPKDGASGEKR